MEITNPNYKTMPEQVNQNTKDIAVLKKTVKTPATIYNATVEMAQYAGVINQSNITQQVTNTNNAFVMDTVGKLFRIVTVENDQVYVAYCASIRGPQGEEGTPGTPANPLTIYPIGSIYMTFDNVSPAELFGGQWEQIKDKFLLASGDTYNNGDTGGEATHILTVNEMPSHDHNTADWNNRATASSLADNGYYERGIFNMSYQAAPDQPALITGTRGGSQAHNNMPPYLVVNVWKRVY